MSKLRVPMVAAALIIVNLAASSHLVAAPTEPSVHDVYQAATAGKYGEAQTMMEGILRDHPNSSKAHFVEAELLAAQSRFEEAETELATALRLKPDMSFAKAEAIAELKSRISGGLNADQSPVYQVEGGGAEKFVNGQTMPECVTVKSLSELLATLDSSKNGLPTLIYARADWAVSAVSVNDDYAGSIAFRRILVDANCIIADTTTDRTGEIAKHFNLIGVPFYILLNSENKEIAKRMGGLDLPKFKAWYRSARQ